MDETVPMNLDLSGIGSAAGGAYHNVRMQGIGKVHGDLECIHCDMEGMSEVIGNIQSESVTIHGKAKVHGKIDAGQLTIEGAAKVAGACSVQHKLRLRGGVKMGGDLTADSIAIEGNNTVDGDCRAQDFKVRGRAKVKGSLFAEDVFMHGSLYLDGSCEAETFRSDGMFRIRGLLSADKVYIRLERQSTVKEIGGEEIRVEKGHGFRWFQRVRKLSVDTIEGDNIYLEHTTAKLVRGNHITLGPSVQVERVEYHSEFRKASNAKVGSSVKL